MWARQGSVALRQLMSIVLTALRHQRLRFKLTSEWFTGLRTCVLGKRATGFEASPELETLEAKPLLVSVPEGRRSTR